MTQTSASDPEADPLAAVRQAAGDVVSALSGLVEAARDVVDDPESFAAVIDRGRCTIEDLFGAGSTVSDDDGESPNH
ncbi:MAG: hypothetical protein GWP47_13275 [Actinobacteria bacterium]|jgi:hypothetical protein|nr:hypothetical protein [Ilumatobacter sp.]NCG25089.1 hypothetical protein [Actinomycetota bacterium]NCG38859.1 hypothetical protein [Actinomycetota bacterium]